MTVSNEVRERDRHAAVGNLWEEQGQDRYRGYGGNLSTGFRKGGYMDVRSEIKSYIVREGLTIGKVLDELHKTKEWSLSRSNFSDKLARGTIRYKEVKELAEALGYEIVWEKK